MNDAEFILVIYDPIEDRIFEAHKTAIAYATERGIFTEYWAFDHKLKDDFGLLIREDGLIHGGLVVLGDL